MGKPICKLSSGTIQAAVWENEFEGKKSRSYSFQKSYKGKDGNWKNTTFFSQTDLLSLGNLCAKICTEKVKVWAGESKQEAMPEPKPENAEGWSEDNPPF